MKIEATVYGDKRVYTVGAFNRGVSTYLQRLPSLWVEGEVTELRRHERWQSVFLTLKDPEDGSCLAVSMPRGQFDALRLELKDGERVHVFGRAELYSARGEFKLRALSMERFGLGDHLASIERLKRKLAADGLFDAKRKRALPLLPRAIGLVTGNDAAAKRDVLTAITGRYPAALVVVAETYVQGPRAAIAVVEALEGLCAQPDVDVIILARGGGSFEDLLPFSDERLVRAVASSPVPVVSAVGHEQDTPLCDLAADLRASTPSVAGRLVVPDAAELRSRLGREREALRLGARRALEGRRERLAQARERLGRAPAGLLQRHAERLERTHDRLERAPVLVLERRRASLEQLAGRLGALSPRATLNRGYAIVRARGAIVRASESLSAGARVEVELAAGGFGARVEETR